MEFKQWAVPITFEGVELSPIAIVIDHLGMYGNLPKLSEESSEWLWRFTICRGRYRVDTSENVEKVVTEVLEQVNKNRKRLLNSVPKHFDGEFSDEHLDLWINDLGKMLLLSKGKPNCKWQAA